MFRTGLVACVLTAAAVGAHRDTTRVSASDTSTHPRSWVHDSEARASCPDSVGLPEATAPNYCADLIPTPDLQQSSGTLILGGVATPFGVATTVDGRPRYRLALSIAGLPPVSRLGPYRAYVAWASTLSMDSVVKLGVVHNGESQLGEIASSQFRVIVSAESSPTVTTRHGKLVLRGTSPSTRLLAHRDITQGFGLGHPATDQSMGHAMAPTSSNSSGAMMWSMPPVDRAAMMMPGMSALEPTVAPWRAGAGVDPMTLPLARPSDTRRLHDGDTVAMTVSLVRRTIADRTFTGYAYNGEVPGPLLIVPQGATIIVPVRNATDLPTTIHWHGVRLDNANDGTDGITQDAIAPGDRFTYRVHFPDAGVFWYHAHHREDIAQPLGLYGNILVLPWAGGALDQPSVNRQEALTIGDLLMDSTGPAPWGAQGPTQALMGRFGNLMLVNGQWRPQWTIRRGEVVRFYLTNVSTARPYNLSFGGLAMKLVGSDGGRLEHEAWVRSIPIAPAERYVVDVQFKSLGDVNLTNRVEALSHMTGAVFPEVDTLATFHVSSQQATPDWSTNFVTLHGDSAAAHDIASYVARGRQVATRELLLQMHLRDLPLPIAAMLNAMSVPVDWNDGMGMMNWVLTPREVTWVIRDPVAGTENMGTEWHFRQGDVVKVRIANDAAMPHAMAHVIHVHGERFLVLARNGQQSDDLVWKDTVLIPAGQTVDLLLDLSTPGRWLFHCHIAEHMEAGMMMSLVVDPPPS